MASGTGANFGELKGFYEQWNATLNTDVKEQAAFSALSKENKAIVMLAFELLSQAKGGEIATDNTQVPTKEQLDRVVDSLRKQFSFKTIREDIPLDTAKVANSYDNIIRMQHLLATPKQKTGIGQVEGALKEVYAQRTVLREVIKPEFIAAMMDGIEIPERTVSAKALFTKMEGWAKANIRKGDFQDAALQIIKDLRESEKGGELNKENFESQVKIFQDRLALAFAELSPKLTSEDLAQLEKTGTKGASHLKLIRDCFTDFLYPLQKAAGVVVDAKGTYNSVRDGFIKLISPNKLERLIATIKEAFHQITNTPLKSLGVVGRGPFESARAQNGIVREIEKLEAQVIGQHKYIINAMNQLPGLTPKEIELLRETIAVYHENSRLLLGLMELKEDLFVKGYILRPHLAAGHGKEIHAQAKVLVEHVAVAVDLIDALSDDSIIGQVKEQMAGDEKLGALTAYRVLLDSKAVPLSDARAEIRADAEERLGRAADWLQYARSRGDKTAPLYLADLICTSYGDAWSAEHADRTFELSRMLLAEVLRGGDSVLRIDAQVAMRSLFQLRLNAAIQNKKSPEEKAYDAHVLIIGMKFINSKLPFASQAKREEALRNQLLGLVEQGSQEAFNEVIGGVKTRVEKGRATLQDVMLLAELNARGLPVQDLIAQAAKTKSSFLRTSPIDSFLAKVEKDIPAQKLTSDSFRTVALLAAHGNARAKVVLEGLNVNHAASLAYAYTQGVELSERGANRAILHWALSSDKSEANFTSQILDDSYRSSATGFYQRYVDSPTKIELDIPVATTLDFSLLDVVDRADRGKITEKDIENLVFAAKNGSRLAASALNKAIVKMSDSRIKTSDGVEKALSFGKWALDNNFPDPETATFPNNNADVEARYKRVLAGPPQPGPSFGQQISAFFGGLTAGDAAERQEFIADMRQVFDEGEITSVHIDGLMKAYRNGVEGAEQLLMDIAGPGEDTFRSLDPLDKQAAQRKVAEIGQTFSLSTSSDVESASIGSIETVESEVLAGPPQPGPSLGQRFAAFFGGLTAGDAAERQEFIADMRKVFEGGKITSDHIDLLMKAYRGRVDGAEQLLRDIAKPASQAFANLEEPALGKARSKSAEIIKLIPGILSSSEEEPARFPFGAKFRDLGVGDQQSSVSTSTSSRTSGRSQFNLFSSFSLLSLGESIEYVPLKGGEESESPQSAPASAQDQGGDLLSAITTTGIGASSFAAAEAATSTFKVSPSFIQRIFGIVDTKAIEGQVEEFANQKVDSKDEWIKEQGKAAFSNFLEDPNAELAKKLGPLDLLANQDSAKALLGLIGKDQHQPLIGLLTEIDGWINEMKVGADRTRDKAEIEKAAVDVLGDRLGTLLFGDGEAVKAKVGLTKEVVAEFLVQHRATIIKIASEETV